jgi:hypothetical protein
MPSGVMSLALKSVTGMKLIRLAGIVVAAVGALLFGLTDTSAATWSAALAPPTMHVDWILLAGLVCIVGGGLLVQITWETRDG